MPQVASSALDAAMMECRMGDRVIASVTQHRGRAEACIIRNAATKVVRALLDRDDPGQISIPYPITLFHPSVSLMRTIIQNVSPLSFCSSSPLFRLGSGSLHVCTIRSPLIEGVRDTLTRSSAKPMIPKPDDNAEHMLKASPTRAGGRAPSRISSQPSCSLTLS